MSDVLDAIAVVGAIVLVAAMVADYFVGGRR